MRSLALRLGLYVFLGELIVLAALWLVTIRIARGELVSAFDASVRGNAEALATLVEIEDDGSLELEFADEIMERFSRSDEPDLFAILDGGGNLIEQSQSLEDLPNWVKPGASEEYHNFHQGATRYRGVVMSVIARDEYAPGREREAPITVFFATSRGSLDAALGRLRAASLVILIGGLLCAALVAMVATRIGLRPLRSFARAIEDVSPGRLDARLDVEKWPQELQRPARAFSALLERLAQAFSRERRFSADAAHELRTPIATLKAAVQAARLTPRDAMADERLLEDLEEEVNRLTELCEQLLLLSSPGVASEDTLTTEQLAEEVRGVVDAMKGAAGEDGSRIALKVPGGGGMLLRGNALAIRRVATNLLRNAIEHAGRDAAIEVRVTALENGAELIVADHGVGIAEEARPRLFERFFRAESSRSRATGGAGLGLAICRELVQACGGEITFQPTQGGGATFVVRLVGVQ